MQVIPDDQESKGMPSRLYFIDSLRILLISLVVAHLLAYAIVSLAVTPFIKFALVTLFGIILSFALSHLIKKLPFTRRIL